MCSVAQMEQNTSEKNPEECLRVIDFGYFGCPCRYLICNTKLFMRYALLT